MSLWKKLALLAAGLALFSSLAIAWFWRPITSIVDVFVVAFEEPDWLEIPDEETMIAFLEAHPEQVSLVIQTIDVDGSVVEESVSHRPDVPMVLASTFKITVLSALARAIDEGVLSAEDPIASDDWESWYLPGTDGDAHLHAYERLDVPHRRGRATPPRTFTVSEVAEAMIRHSDNAATDVLIERLGTRVQQEAERLGHGPIHPVLEDFVGMYWEGDLDLSDPVARREVTSRSVPMGRLSYQRSYLADSMCRGSAGLYTRIQAGVGSGTWISEDASAFMADKLDWPMDNDPMKERASRMGTKGGAVAGVLTEATYLVPVDGPHQGRLRVGALMMNDLSGSAWIGMLESFQQQKLLLRMLQDDALAKRVARRLVP